MAQVMLRKLVKNYDETPAVRGIDLDIADKEFVVLVGPSGCGKSTTLRMIAGLEDITAGDVLIGGEVVNDMPPKDRDIAMVFQNYALYPHMSVYENMSFGLRLKKVAERRDRAARRERGADPRHQRAAAAQTEAALRRTAPARRDGARDRARPEGVPVRRAAVQSRRQAARADAHRDQEGAPEGAHHHRLRDARPDRSDDARRPRGGDERRQHRAGGDTERPLPQPHDQIRRRLHRLAGDELRALHDRGGGRRIARSPEQGHRLSGAAGTYPALPRARRQAQSAVRPAPGTHHGTASAYGTEPAPVRGRAGGDRTDGDGDDGVLSDRGHRAGRSRQSRRGSASGQAHEAGCRPRQDAPDRRRQRASVL